MMTGTRDLGFGSFFWLKSVIRFCLFVGIRQQRQDAGPLDGLGQHTLMLGAVAGDPTRQDLAAFRDILTELGSVLVVDGFSLVHTEAANTATAAAVASAAREIPFSPFRTAGSFFSHVHSSIILSQMPASGLEGQVVVADHLLVAAAGKR